MSPWEVIFCPQHGVLGNLAIVGPCAMGAMFWFRTTLKRVAGKMKGDRLRKRA